MLRNKMDDNRVSEYWKVVAHHHDEYARRPALRMAYEYWADRIRDCLAKTDGLSIELGCGCGALSGYFPEFIKTDIHKHAWVDDVVDACAMTYGDNECANLIAVDVLHHLPSASEFFDEVSRVLKFGGRLVLLEPYISFASYIVYRYFHHEFLDMKARPLERDMMRNDGRVQDCNEGIPTLVFTRYRNEFCEKWPKLRIVSMQPRDFIVYPLTGGFSRRCWLPVSLIKPLMKTEDVILRPFSYLAAMRILVVIEKTGTDR